MKAGSLWVVWIDSYILKGVDIWQVQSLSWDSWAWRKILKLRNEILHIGIIKGSYKAIHTWETLMH